MEILCKYVMRRGLHVNIVVISYYPAKKFPAGHVKILVLELFLAKIVCSKPLCAVGGVTN